MRRPMLSARGLALGLTLCALPLWGQSPNPTISPATLPNGLLGSAYSQTLTASGGYGAGTYSFSLDTDLGPPPTGLKLSTAGVLSGTLTAAGTFTFRVLVTSTESSSVAYFPPLTGSQAFTIAVLPGPPNITITGLPASAKPATQPVLGVSVGSAYPSAIQGEITLTFAPTTGMDDPNVQFTSGGRTVTFQVPAGFTTAQFTGNAPGVQTGTVAGAITLTLTLTAAGANITPTPAPTDVLTVAASPPVITSATYEITSGGFNLFIEGFSTTRDMTSAAITFTSQPDGVPLTSNSATAPLSQVFTTWYESSASAGYGSMFLLTIPFTAQNNPNPQAPVQALGVVLANSQGNSAVGSVIF
jgi:hypothetical protein